MDRTAGEFEARIKKYGLKLAAELEYYASYILENGGDEDEAESYNHNADVVRAGLDGMFPAQDCWPGNVIPLPVSPKADPLAPDRPRCRG